jgi:hypothetical protein
MRRLVLFGLLWLFCLGSVGGCGSGSEDSSGEKKDATKRKLRTPDPKKI